MKLTMRIIAFCMLVSLVLAACAPAATPAAPQNTQAPGTTATQAEGAQEPTQAGGVPAEGQVTIKIWDFGGEEFDWVDNIAIPEFNKKYPNIKVEHLGIPESDYSTKLDTAITANEVPDLALQSYTYKLWKAGHVLPLDNYMAKANLKPDDFYSIFQSWCMLDGKVYCMPVNTYVWAMIYNKDLFKAAGLPELGVDDVITFDEWLEYARKVNKTADNLEERVFGTVNFTPNWNAMNNYMSDPYVLGSDGRNCKDSAATEDWIKAWTNMQTAYKEELTVDTA
ncbi:MAG: extracellular solute-binding protein, partial [Chloroflexi bacterium]